MKFNVFMSVLLQYLYIQVKKKIPKRCWGCLGDRNDEFDELVECDGCGVTVHESKLEICAQIIDLKNYSMICYLIKSYFIFRVLRYV